MSIERILVIVSIALSVLTIICSFFAKIFKGKKTGTIAQRIYDVSRQIQLAIIDAETHSNYSGVEKLDYVMTGITKYLMKENIKLDETTIKGLIENEIDLSNRVNTPSTKKSPIVPEHVESAEKVEIVSRETIETNEIDKEE